MSGRRSGATGAMSTCICRRRMPAASAIRSSTCRTARTCRIRRPRLPAPGSWTRRSIVSAWRGVEAIFVGVHNTRSRLAEYSPFPDPRHGGGDADAYLAFVAETLKPRIDRLFIHAPRSRCDRDPRVVDGRAGQPLRVFPLPVGVRTRRRDEPGDLVRAAARSSTSSQTRDRRAAGSTWTSARARVPEPSVMSAASDGCW